MDAAQIYGQVLNDLSRTVVRMTSPEFDLLLQQGTTEERQRAGRELLRLQQARLVLGNVALQSIVGELKGNEEAFVQGRTEVRRALERLENVAQVLNSITSFVNLVARVVPLL